MTHYTLATTLAFQRTVFKQNGALIGPKVSLISHVDQSFFVVFQEQRLNKIIFDLKSFA